MKLHDYQEKAVTKALALGGRWIFGDEMGLGKTPQAIECLKRRSCKTALIVCPALVRRNWIRELDTWWPEHPEIGIIEYGRNRKLSKPKTAARQKAYAAPIQIVSYALLSEIPQQPFDAIVFDEAHMLQSPGAKASKAALRITEGLGRTALRIALTATPIPDQPKQIWNLVDLVWPGRFGRRHKKWGIPYSFLERYTNEQVNQYGTSFTGVNELHANELQVRLSALHSRTTKQDVAYLLPPFDVKTLRVGASSDFGMPFVDPERYSWRAHDERVGQAMLKAGHEKVKHVLEWAESCGAPHRCIMTHHRAVAEAICEQIPGAVYINGDVPIQERAEIIERLKVQPHSTLVATIQSLGIGIDLTHYTQTLFVQIHPRPEVMLQALGRFSRLSGKLPSTVWLLVVEGTLDESQASALERKIKDINAVLKAGRDDTKLKDSFSISPEKLKQLVERAVTKPEGWDEDLEAYFE